MDIVFKKASLEDAKELLMIQRKSFKEALELYQDFDTNPKFEKMEKISYKIKNHYYYKIILDRVIIGGAHVYKKGDCHYYINRVFIDPDFENLGIGKKIMEFIENEFSDAKIFSLETPHKSFKNHYFYEKLGYARTGKIEEISENLSLIYYEKSIVKC